MTQDDDFCEECGEYIEVKALCFNTFSSFRYVAHCGCDTKRKKIQKITKDRKEFKDNRPGWPAKIKDLF